jgi:dienelactone hydrolase
MEKSQSRDTKSEKEKRWKRLRTWFKRLWNRLPPSSAVRRGTVWGITLMIVSMAVLSGLFVLPGLPSPINPLIGILFFLIMAGLMWLALFLGIKILSQVPRFISLAGLISLIVLFLIFKEMGFPTGPALLSTLMFGLGGAFLGGGLAALFNSEFRFFHRLKKIGTILFILIPLAFFISMTAWLLHRGSSEHLTEYLPPRQVNMIPAPNPSRSGAFAVKSLTYGSGTGRRRPEFGRDAALITEPVDATPFVKGNKGFRMKLRKWYWGFDFEEFPVNGTVWYPEGEGPFPLVLCVHGNHKMEDYSDPGYAYLGEHLAGRGFIFVSVDENFFNGSFLSHLRRENDGRGWMLLQHFKVWRTWNREQGNPFFGKVDMDNLGIIGHSRGGEAASIAANFNRLKYYPDDATVAFDFDFNLKAVIAIAPSDQQYKPSGWPNPITNVNYLTIQGAHDADVSVFAGAKQYNRVKFTNGGDYFKAYVYSYRSNHGQFNTVWGDTDFGMPLRLFLNRKPLLDGDDQRILGKVYFTAFLEATLMGKREYIPLFRDYRKGLDWLPADFYVNRYEDSTFRVVCDFDEDVDVTTGTLEGVVIRGDHLPLWREEDLSFRTRGTKANNVAVLGWRVKPELEDKDEKGNATEPGDTEQEIKEGNEQAGGRPAVYSIILPDEPGENPGLDERSKLVFSLCEADEDLPEKEENDAGENKDEVGEGENKEDSSEKNDDPSKGEDDKSADKKDEEPEPPLDFTLSLEDADGTFVRFPISRFRRVPAVLKSRFLKFKDESDLYGKAYEPTLQLFEIPLADYSAENPEFNPMTLRVIRFIFDRGREGVVFLDRLGFAR